MKSKSKSESLLTDIGWAKAGDYLVYGNLERVKIVNFPKIDGQPGIQLSPSNALFLSDRFKTQAEVARWVKLGIWKIESSA